MKKRLSSVLSAIACAAAVIPAQTSAFEPKPEFTSAFLNTYQCRQWSTERWEQELSYAKELGFDTLIIPAVLDIQYQLVNTVWGSAPEPECYSMFPLETSVDYDVKCSGDSLKSAFEAAKTVDIKLWLGTVRNNMWSFDSNGATSSFYEDITEINTKLSNDLITEIWTRYGEEYGDCIAGWYYSNKFINFESACKGTDDGVTVRIISDSINSELAVIDKLCPDKPFMINPDFYYDNSTSEEWGNFIGELINASNLRPTDIYTANDNGGMPNDVDLMYKWTEAQKKAVGDKMHFYVENECASYGKPSVYLSKLYEYYTATHELAEKNILSFNAFFAGSNDKLKDGFYDLMSGVIRGDVNDDGKVNVADLVMFQKWLLGAPDAEIANHRAADMCRDEYLDSIDLCLLRKSLLVEKNGEYIVEEPEEEKFITVTGTDELFSAVENAKPGDIIKVAPGEYDLSGKTLKATADGTEDNPICIMALDAGDAPVIKCKSTENGYVMHITGDYWNVEGFVFTNAQKGIVLDNSNSSRIYDCEIHTTGAEAIAIRDGSSYCTIEKCNIHDTGLVSPGYGEGVYIGSSKEKTEFDFNCDHNKVIDCTFKNVAAEHIDVKEYTTDTEISGCTFYGDGMTGENYAGSFIDIKGNKCNVHDNTGYRNGNPKIVAAFEIHEQVQGWGYHHVFENNTLYLDQPYGEENTNRRIYIVDGWFSDFKVKSNKVDYGEGLVPATQKTYYNSDNVTIIQEPAMIEIK